MMERIIKLMQEKKITQVELAKRIGTSQGRIANWKRDNTDPPAEMLIKIAKILDVDIDYLINGDIIKKEQIDYLTENEKKLIKLYRAGNTPDKKMILDLAKRLCQDKIKNEESSILENTKMNDVG